MGRIAFYALKYSPTVIVGVILVLFFGLTAVFTAPTDIFPNIDIPVVSVIWTFSGLPAEEFERRITTLCEVSLSTAVNDVRSIQSTTRDGVAIIRLYLQPDAHVETAIAQATASSQSVVKRLPRGITPPVVVRYSAASVPVIQLALTSKTLSDATLYDYGIYRVRQLISSVRGTTVPPPYGGRTRQIRVDLDPDSLLAHGLSPRDVNDALNAQNVVAPSGRAKVGSTDYRIFMNNSPSALDALDNLPIRRNVYVKDVGHVFDGGIIQTNSVRAEGSPAVLITVLKNGAASTLKIVSDVLAKVPDLQRAAPAGLKLQPLFDQSIFVRAAVENVLHEALIAAGLTGGLILLFLGSWRSTMIVLTSIPLAILSSIMVLRCLGHTMNIMTLGGLSLAIGILVDDATVTIENIHRNAGMRKPFVQAILDGAKQIANPAFTVMMCICIVFASVGVLEGASYFLFVPFALAVVSAVVASFVLSRGLVPVLIYKFLGRELGSHDEAHSGLIYWVHVRFDRGFNRFKAGYSRVLLTALRHPLPVFGLVALFFCSSLLMLGLIGEDFFPSVDAGQFRLHVKCPPGTRLEVAETLFSQVEDEIRRLIPPSEIKLMLDNVGLPADSTAMAFSDTTTQDTSDGEILVSLNRERSHSTPEYQRLLRLDLVNKFPNLEFYYQPADMVSQILNAGLPSPIDIRVAGKSRAKNLEIARALVREVKNVPGAVDVRLHQEVRAPAIKIQSDRTLMMEHGLTQKDLADDVLVAVSGSQQVSPTFWVDPENGQRYFVVVQTPQRDLSSLESLAHLSITTRSGPQLLENLATLQRLESPALIDHVDIQPVYDVFANVESRDLGGVAKDIERIVAPYRSKLDPGNYLMVRGLVEQLDTTFARLAFGFVVALVLVYLVLVMNYQSWVDAAIIIMALPGAGCGIIWGLYAWHTTFSVPSLMGAIMCLGVATANSVLVVSFAREQMDEGLDSVGAALEAGCTRLRPVMMTALAMIVGMIPMSLGLGEGGEQNAPLGRAVIGGLTVATAFTLLFVPVVFAWIRRKGRPVVDDPTVGYEV